MIYILLGACALLSPVLVSLAVLQQLNKQPSNAFEEYKALRDRK